MAMQDLISRWKQTAEVLRAFSAATQAEVLEKCASDLEAHITQRDLEALTLDAAAFESGYSYSALQKQVASGFLDNVGSKGSPRVRRRDLPRKGGSPKTGLADDILLRRLG